MRKLSKILIPVASAVAVATPITCLVSCSKSDFACDKLFPSTLLGLRSNAIDVVPNKVYTVSVDLSKLKEVGTSFTAFTLMAESESAADILEFDENLCKISLNGEKVAPITPEGPIITGASKYTSISFEVGFKSKANGVFLVFSPAKSTL